MTLDLVSPVLTPGASAVCRNDRVWRHRLQQGQGRDDRLEFCRGDNGLSDAFLSAGGVPLSAPSTKRL